MQISSEELHLFLREDLTIYMYVSFDHYRYSVHAEVRLALTRT